jgi:hypothetical protein
MLDISEEVEGQWKDAAKKLRRLNIERRRKGQRGLSEKQWRDIENKKKLKNEKERIKSLAENGGLVTYFIQGQVMRLIKIGLAKNISERLNTLQCGSPDNLVVLKTISGNVERVYHKRFAHFRLHGEWFRPAPELLEFIKEL